MARWRPDSNLPLTVLDQKRQEIFAEAQKSLATVPLETLRERRKIASYEAVTIRDVQAKYGDAVDGTALLPKGSRKRAVVTEAQVELLHAGMWLTMPACVSWSSIGVEWSSVRVA